MKPRTTGKHPSECPSCEGVGYTKASATEMERQDGKLITVKLGSACLRCHGTGRLNMVQMMNEMAYQRISASNALIDNATPMNRQ